MGQYWQLVNIDGRFAVFLGKLAEGIWSINLHSYLAPDAAGALISLEELRRKLADTHPLPPLHEQKQSRLLTVLGQDLVRHIFDCFGDPADMLANVDAARFALACQFCYQVGYGVLNRRHEAFRSWAGQRLIIAGDYQDVDYLPPCLSLPPMWFPPGETIFEASSSDSFTEPLPPLKDAVQKLVVECMHDEARSIPEAEEADAVERQWKAMFSPAGPQMENPTLRNLSKKEYARGEVLEAAQDGKDRDYGFGALRIGDLVVFRICWSSDGYGNMTNARLAPGEWAGDCFDIVEFADADLSGWKDVSASLVQEVAKIYRDEEW